MIPAIALGIVAFLVVAVVLSRQTSKNKKRAIDDLQTERESVGAYDIFAMVESEVQTLGLTKIDGAEGISHPVLLKSRKDHQDIVGGCGGRDHRQWVVRSGVDPGDATDADVSLACSKRAPTDDPGAED